MNKTLKHVVRYVRSKGIIIKRTDEDCSYFDYKYPDRIFIEKHSPHSLSAAILHEYYHAVQYRRHQWSVKIRRTPEHATKREYYGEQFVIRCFRKLGMVYNQEFVDKYWCKDSDYKPNKCYANAYDLLKENGWI